MSSFPSDPYKILGVSKDAQLPEIRGAHRKLVLKCHPDKIQDPKLKEEKQKEFQQVQQAYELLSNDVERARYDDKVLLEELRRERGVAPAASSSPRNSRRHESKHPYDVHDAEPRPSTFATSPTNNVYGHTPPRSWNDDMLPRKPEDRPHRHARKTASYEHEKPSSRKDEDRRKREDDDWLRSRDKDGREADRRSRERDRDVVREKDREKDKDKEHSKKDRDRRKDDKKKAEKDRRKDTDDKHRRHKSPYVEGYPEDRDEVPYTSSSSKTEKKKPTSRKYEEPTTPPLPRETSRPPATERERKNSATLESAMRYLTKSGGKAPMITRAQTFHEEYTYRHVNPIAVPTPPPAAGSAFPPPPAADPRDAPLEEDTPKRPSARVRRMSHDTPRSSKEKSSHKKSGLPREAIIVDTSPTRRTVPSFQKSHSIPIPIPPHLGRSNTDGPPRPPGLERAATWMPGADFAQERGRSRHTRVYTDESSEEDRDRRHRRTRRTRSPEVMPTHTTVYKLSDGRTVQLPEQYIQESPPRSSKKASYPMANSGARRVDPRGYYSSYEDEPQPFMGSVMYTDTFDPSDIKYSSERAKYTTETYGSGEVKFSELPRSSYRETVY
ncbi:DnaJ-domain-containing protein [Durotheca rogersii]|uniref:DnaJ-domain-containing protein n=1 Tax=Durotheca rogersii TaxID=419775 RepID=UPI00221EE8E3|nr:DnaJ-domain-containing protein [Durotheca rogersii]KAI5865259.1 DnaJ-domain-containing protein [Durotheca rogersii]